MPGSVHHPTGCNTAVTAHRAPPPQLDKVNTAITPNRPEVPALSTVQFPRLEQALLCHCLPIPIRTFFLPGQFSTNTMGGPDNSFKKTRLNHSSAHPPSLPPTAQPNQFFLHPLFTTSSTTIRAELPPLQDPKKQSQKEIGICKKAARRP